MCPPCLPPVLIVSPVFCCLPPPPEALPWSCALSAVICQIICCLCPLLDDVCTMCSVHNFSKQSLCSSLLLLILSLPMWVYQLPVYFYMMSLLCNLFMLLYQWSLRLQWSSSLHQHHRSAENRWNAYVCFRTQTTFSNKCQLWIWMKILFSINNRSFEAHSNV